MTAIFNPFLLDSMAFSKVVLPAPKNPDKTVTGSTLVIINIPLNPLKIDTL